MSKETVTVERLSVIIKRLGWRFHASLVVFILLCFGIAIKFSFGYYEAATPAAATLAILIIRYWAVFSKKLWFWLTVLVFAFLQIPLVMACKDLANHYGALFMFLEAFVDFMVMNGLVLWLSPQTVELTQQDTSH
jgi:hypothetical protein